MRKPKSEFVLSQIAGRRFTPGDRRYIEDLLTIENYVLQPPSGQWGGMSYNMMRRRHPAEFDAIHAALRPDDFRKQQRERARFAREEQRDAARARRAERRKTANDRALWVSLGGLP